MRPPPLPPDFFFVNANNLSIPFYHICLHLLYPWKVLVDCRFSSLPVLPVVSIVKIESSYAILPCPFSLSVLTYWQVSPFVLESFFLCVGPFIAFQNTALYPLPLGVILQDFPQIESWAVSPRGVYLKGYPRSYFSARGGVLI